MFLPFFQPVLPEIVQDYTGFQLCPDDLCLAPAHSFQGPVCTVPLHFHSHPWRQEKMPDCGCLAEYQDGPGPVSAPSEVNMIVTQPR